MRRALTTRGGLLPRGKLDRALADLWPESGDALALAARSRSRNDLVGERLAGAVARHATGDGVLTLVDLLAAQRLTPSGALRAGRELTKLLATERGRERIGETRTIAADRAESSLNATSAPLRRGAVSLYAAVAGRLGAKHLTALARDPDSGVRAETARALGRLGRGAAPVVIRRLLRDTEPAVRAAALEALAREDLPENALPEAEADPSAAVRATCARVLAMHASAANRRALERLLVDDSARVRAAARRSLDAFPGAK